MKTLLNRYDNPTLRDFIWVGAGDVVKGRCHAEEFYITEDKEYEIVDVNGLHISVINDKGLLEFYSVEYFKL